MPYNREDLIPKDGSVQTARPSLILIRSQCRLIQMTLNHMQMEKRESEWQKGQDLWSHLASNSFTFCSLQLDIRGAGRAEWPGAGAKGQDVTSDSGPHQPNQRDTAGRSVPALRTKERGRTLARQPPCSWLDSNSCLTAFKGVRWLQDHVQQSLFFFFSKTSTHIELFHRVCGGCDLAWKASPPASNTRTLQSGDADKSGFRVGLWPYMAKFWNNYAGRWQAVLGDNSGGSERQTVSECLLARHLLARAESPVKAVHKAAGFSCINNESLLLLKEMQVANQPIQRTFLAFFSMFSGGIQVSFSTVTCSKGLWKNISPNF